MDVLSQIIRRHVDMTNSNRQAQDLLHLELNGGLDFFNLSNHRLAVSQGGRELASLVQARAKQTGNLLDQSFTGKESIIFLGCGGQEKVVFLYLSNITGKFTKILDKFLVLVQLLQGFSIHAWDIVGSSFIAMLLVTKNADRHFWSGDMLEPVE